MLFNVATFPDSYCKQVLDTIATRHAGIVSTSGPTSTDKFGTQYRQMLTLMTVTLTLERDQGLNMHPRPLRTAWACFRRIWSRIRLELTALSFSGGATIAFRKWRTCRTYTMANESEARNVKPALFPALQLAGEAGTM